jgi:hypothetical protein
VHSASWVQTEELLDRKVAAPVYKTEKYGRRDPSRWPRGTFYPHKLPITSPTSGGRSVGIVRSRTQTMELSYDSHKRTKPIKIEHPKWCNRKTSFSTLVEKCKKFSLVAPKSAFLVANNSYWAPCVSRASENPAVSSGYPSSRVQLINDREHLTDQWQWPQTDTIVSHAPVSSVQSRLNCRRCCNPAPVVQQQTLSSLLFASVPPNDYAVYAASTSSSFLSFYTIDPFSCHLKESVHDRMLLTWLYHHSEPGTEHGMVPALHVDSLAWNKAPSQIRHQMDHNFKRFRHSKLASALHRLTTQYQNHFINYENQLPPKATQTKFLEIKITHTNQYFAGTLQ